MLNFIKVDKCIFYFKSIMSSLWNKFWKYRHVSSWTKFQSLIDYFENLPINGNILKFVFCLQFLAENTLVDAETFLKYLPSQIASACVCLARYSLGQDPWVRQLNLLLIFIKWIVMKNLKKKINFLSTRKFYCWINSW